MGNVWTSPILTPEVNVKIAIFCTINNNADVVKWLKFLDAPKMTTILIHTFELEHIIFKDKSYIVENNRVIFSIHCHNVRSGQDTCEKVYLRHTTLDMDDFEVINEEIEFKY
jgi:hypothetical protein